MHRSKWMIGAMAIAVAIVTTGCTKLRSRDELNQGVQAYKNAHYVDAVKHFRSAVELDPTNQNAQLYLATTYFSQWVPGAESPENNRAEQAAKAEFQKVLDKDPQNRIALASLAAMAYSKAGVGTQEEKDKALEEAKKWNMRRIEADPRDSEAYYSLGVIAWAQTYSNIQTARNQVHMGINDPGPIKDKKVREEMKEKYGKTVEEGMADLQKAIEIDKENDDAMTYLNLLLRKKADLDDDPETAKADIAKAEDWANKSLDIKKIKAARPQNKQQAS
jgi:tetratricopeptide (TPR) repeat protein